MSLHEIPSLIPTISGKSPWQLFLLFSLLAFLSFWLCRLLLLRVLRTIAGSMTWGGAQVFCDARLLSQVSWLLPTLVIHLGARVLTELPDWFRVSVERVSLTFFVIFALRSISLFLGKVNEVYSKLEAAKDRPIKGLIQVVLIILYLFGLILIFSILFDRSPLVFLSGLGAMTAILLLIFRDTLLSLVAGVQLTTNNLVRMGDWIEMPQFGADGDVVDIALHAVRVQNWDKTITVIPTHKFLEHSFKNWRGMHEAGGRRIKRSLHIDVSTIRFLTESEIDRLGRFELISEYVDTKKKELEAYNRSLDLTDGKIANSRRLTNVGTFRAYLAHYLKRHPMIRQDMTFLVRQLAPGEHGLPIEIYVFVKDTRWAVYESVQADIFDHILAIIGEFGLSIHQSPSGADIRGALHLNARD